MLTEDIITELTIDLTRRYLCIESKTDVKRSLTLNVINEFNNDNDLDVLEFFVLKPSINQFNNVSTIFNARPLSFSRINPNINLSTVNKIKSSLQLINYTPLLQFHDRLELDVSNIGDDSKVCYAFWRERPVLTESDSDKMPMGLGTDYFEFILKIPAKYNFIFSKNESKKLESPNTLVYFSSNKHYLDLSLLNNGQLVDPVYKSPCHITLKSFEIPPNCFINGGFNDSIGIISLGTFMLPTDNNETQRISNQNDKYVVAVPAHQLNQSLEIKIYDSNLIPVDLTDPSYIILKLNMVSP